MLLAPAPTNYSRGRVLNSALSHAIGRSLRESLPIIVWVVPKTGMVYVRSTAERNPNVGAMIAGVARNGAFLGRITMY